MLKLAGVTGLEHFGTDKTTEPRNIIIKAFWMHQNVFHFKIMICVSCWFFLEFPKIYIRLDLNNRGCVNIKITSYQYRTPMSKMRRSRYRLIFNTRNPYLERRSLYWIGAKIWIKLTCSTLLRMLWTVINQAGLWNACNNWFCAVTPIAEIVLLIVD